MGALPVCAAILVFFSWKLIESFRLCVMYVGEGNDSNV